MNRRLCHRDHLVAYNCDEFKRLIEKSGWSCVSSWEAMGKPDKWIMNRYGLIEAPRGEGWVSDHEKRQMLCTRHLVAEKA